MSEKAPKSQGIIFGSYDDLIATIAEALGPTNCFNLTVLHSSRQQEEKLLEAIVKTDNVSDTVIVYQDHGLKRREKDETILNNIIGAIGNRHFIFFTMDPDSLPASVLALKASGRTVSILTSKFDIDQLFASALGEHLPAVAQGPANLSVAPQPVRRGISGN